MWRWRQRHRRLPGCRANKNGGNDQLEFRVHIGTRFAAKLSGWKRGCRVKVGHLALDRGKALTVKHVVFYIQSSVTESVIPVFYSHLGFIAFVTSRCGFNTEHFGGDPVETAYA